MDTIERIMKLMLSHQSWWERHGSQIEDEALEEFRTYIQSEEDAAPLLVAFRLTLLANVYASIYIKDILKSSSNRLVLSKAFAFRLWSLKLRFKFFSRRPFRPDNMSNDLSRAACLSCFPASLSEDSTAILQSMYESPRLINYSCRQRRSFEEFAYLCSHLSEEPFESPSTMREPYKSIAVSWHDPERLARAVAEACEYHLLQTEDDGGDWKPEFDNTPFDIIPCEVVLIRRVRAEMGLEMPVIDHDLVRLYDERIGEIEPYPGDEILNRAKKMYDEFL